MDQETLGDYLIYGEKMTETHSQDRFLLRAVMKMRLTYDSGNIRLKRTWDSTCPAFYPIHKSLYNLE